MFTPSSLIEVGPTGENFRMKVSVRVCWWQPQRTCKKLKQFEPEKSSQWATFERLKACEKRARKENHNFSVEMVSYLSTPNRVIKL